MRGSGAGVNIASPSGDVIPEFSGVVKNATALKHLLLLQNWEERYIPKFEERIASAEGGRQSRKGPLTIFSKLACVASLI